MSFKTEWETAPSDLKGEKVRHPYDLWYRGNIGKQGKAEKSNDKIFPALFVIEGLIASTDELNKFVTAVDDSVKEANSQSGSAKTRVALHDFVHCVFDLASIPLTGHGTVFVNKGELIVFLGAGVRPRKFARILKKNLMGAGNYDVRLAFVGPTFAPANSSDPDLATGFAKFRQALSGFLPNPALFKTTGGVNPENQTQQLADDTGNAESEMYPTDKVVSLVIDHAIGFANSRFCREKETRFFGFWAQQVDQNNESDDPIGIGTALNRDEINAKLQELGTQDVPNEIALYRKAGILDRRCWILQQAMIPTFQRIFIQMTTEFWRCNYQRDWSREPMGF